MRVEQEKFQLFTQPPPNLMHSQEESEKSRVGFSADDGSGCVPRVKNDTHDD